MQIVILVSLFSIVLCNKDIAVLILARGGSKGIPLKNLKQIGGLSLLARSITAAKKAGLTDITVSTDHPFIALEAIKFGVSVHRRSYVTATDYAPSIWGAAEFIAFAPHIKILLLIQPTSPFIQYNDLQKALKKLEYPKPYDCVFSATRTYKLRWKIENESIVPINFNYLRRPRRQDWDGELMETGAFYVSRVELIKQGVFQNKNCTVVEVSAKESYEIDSYYDLLVANALFNLQ